MGEMEEEEEEVPMGDKEVDVIGMGRKQMIVARLAAAAKAKEEPKQKKGKKKIEATRSSKGSCY